MKTLLALLLLIPSLSWGDDIILLCKAYKSEAKDFNSSFFTEIKIFNGLSEPVQTIQIKYTNGEPDEMIFSPLSYDLNFSKINETFIKFGTLWWDNTNDAPIKSSLEVNRVSLQAKLKYVMGSSKSISKDFRVPLWAASHLILMDLR